MCELSFYSRRRRFFFSNSLGDGEGCCKLLAISCEGRHHFVHDVHDDFRVLWLEYQGRPETDSRLSAAPDKDAALAHAKDKRVAFGLARSVNSNEGT